ncbi:hypothetical protein PIB30_097344 [Stylosanthes scabra]|uniref:Uncharacterized protein n=1 Tax=Stylosanthes scabra TaxID=79078 RepID=A0ABU6QWY0_9FABA|nr:hypothetical protein [Stylosanthes scabra]
MQLPTSQHTPWLASLGNGWARSESDAPGASGYARTRTSMQAQWATTYRRPWPTREGTRPGSQGPGDGLLTPKPPLHAINMMKPYVHEKNDRNRRGRCLNLAHLIDLAGLNDAPVRCHVRGPHELQQTHGSELHSQKFKLKQATGTFLRSGIRTSSTPTRFNSFRKSSILRV